MVTLFVGAAQQGNRSSSPFSPKTVLPDSSWQLERGHDKPLAALERTVGAYVLHNREGHLAVYHWNLGDQGLLRETVRSLLAIDSTPYARRRAGTVVRLATRVESDAPEDLEAGWQQLERFARDFATPLNGL